MPPFHEMDSSTASFHDEPSFARFAVEIGPEAFRLALHWARNRTEAEDIVQEALSRAWQFQHAIRSNGRGWFFRILWHVYLDRKKRRQREVPIENHRIFDKLDQEPPPIDSWITMEDLLQSLPELDRHLLLMRYGLDLPVQDMAEMLGLSAGTVKSRIHRTLKRLRKDLAVQEEPLAPEGGK